MQWIEQMHTIWTGRQCQHISFRYHLRYHIFADHFGLSHFLFEAKKMKKIELWPLEHWGYANYLDRVQFTCIGRFEAQIHFAEAAATYHFDDGKILDARRLSATRWKPQSIEFDSTKWQLLSRKHANKWIHLLFGSGMWSICPISIGLYVHPGWFLAFESNARFVPAKNRIFLDFPPIFSSNQFDCVTTAFRNTRNSRIYHTKWAIARIYFIWQSMSGTKNEWRERMKQIAVNFKHELIVWRFARLRSWAEWSWPLSLCRHNTI